MVIPSNIILHIPHSSSHIPSYDGFLVGDHELINEINLLTDWYTDELFDLPIPKIIAPFSRVFCDVERFVDDNLEIMAQKGMGMCYTHLDNGELMRVVRPELREYIKSEFYSKHHKILEAMTTELLQEFGKVSIIDCHSFSDIPSNRDMDKELPRPDFCLGVDEFHTPEILWSTIKERLTSHGYNVMINRPYSGTLIPMKYYRKNENVKGIMIEVNRRLYMTLSNGIVSKTNSLDNIKVVIADLCAHLPI